MLGGRRAGLGQAGRAAGARSRVDLPGAAVLAALAAVRYQPSRPLAQAALLLSLLQANTVDCGACDPVASCAACCEERRQPVAESELPQPAGRPANPAVNRTGSCTGLATPRSGWWRLNQTSPRFHRCPGGPAACLGGIASRFAPPPAAACSSLQQPCRVMAAAAAAVAASSRRSLCSCVTGMAGPLCTRCEPGMATTQVHPSGTHHWRASGADSSKQ